MCNFQKHFWSLSSSSSCFHQFPPEETNLHRLSQSKSLQTVHWFYSTWERNYFISPQALSICFTGGTLKDKLFNLHSRAGTMDISGKAALMFYSFSLQMIQIFHIPIALEVNRNWWGSLRAFRMGLRFLVMWMYVCLCVFMLIRTRTLSASTDSAHLLLIHAFSPFLYAARRLDMKRATLIGDCFLCRFRSTLPHREFTEK